MPFVIAIFRYVCPQGHPNESNEVYEVADLLEIPKLDSRFPPTYSCALCSGAFTRSQLPNLKATVHLVAEIDGVPVDKLPPTSIH